MWCEEITEKNDELTQDSTWFFCAGEVSYGVSRAISRTRGSGCVPLPRIPRNDRRMDLTLQLLEAYYLAPADFRTRCGTWPIAFHMVRAFLLRNMVNAIDAPAASYFRQTGTALPAVLVERLKTIAAGVLTIPAGRGVVVGQGGYGTIGDVEDIVVALIEIILQTGALDVFVWSLLWVWAYGGPNGQAQIRTRAHAVQALGVIAQRNPKLAGGAGAARSIAALSDQLQHGTPPKTYAEVKEREGFAVAASLAAGSIAAAGAPVPPELLNPAAYLPPGSMRTSLPLWVPIVGALGIVSLLAGIAVALRGRRSGASGASSHRRLST